MLVINVVEKYFRLGLKYLIPLKKKINSLCRNYCTNYIHKPTPALRFISSL